MPIGPACCRVENRRDLLIGVDKLAWLRLLLGIDVPDERRCDDDLRAEFQPVLDRNRIPRRIAEVRDVLTLPDIEQFGDGDL